MIATPAAGAIRPLTGLAPWQMAVVLEIAGFCAGAALPRIPSIRLVASALGLMLLWARSWSATNNASTCLGRAPLLLWGLWA